MRVSVKAGVLSGLEQLEADAKEPVPTTARAGKTAMAKGNGISDLPLRRATAVPVEQLHLDSENPRLLGSDSATDEVGIIDHLYRSEDLGELLDSMAANGYMDIEPLVVLREAGSRRLVVLEGNRRLAVIRLFRDESLASRISRATGLKVSVPEISDTNRRTLDEVSVYRVAKRAEARSYIGFKHINGAVRWNSYAKAKFAADWYRASKTSLEGIAQQIGDKHDTVRRMVNAIHVLEQAESKGVFSISDRNTPRFEFSHLYIALNRPAYRKFLGLRSGWASYVPSPNPVPASKLNQLGELMGWIYGSKQDDLLPVIQSQNPGIKELGEVLESPKGLLVLRSQRSLERACAAAKPADAKLQDALIEAQIAMQGVVANLLGFKNGNRFLFEIAEDVLDMAQTTCDQMQRKKGGARPN